MNAVRVRSLILAVAVAGLPAAASPQAPANPRAQEALQRLQRATGGAAIASEHRATAVSRFVRLAPGSAANLSRVFARTARAKEDASADFFRSYGAAIGVDDPTALRLVSTRTDRAGGTHLTWQQFHGEVPVFAGTVKTHFDAQGRLRAVNGTSIPDLTVNESPIWSSDDAAEVAHRSIAAEHANAPAVGIGSTTLYVYRTGLAQGVPGHDHLAWEIEVTDGFGIRELVYVDAHTGKLVDRLPGIHDALYRRAFDGHHFDHVPVNYPNGAYWFEGRLFPTPFQEANNMIVASQETYGLFAEAFDRDSFDGEGAIMDAVFDRGYSCPNASWNGTFISFCPGTTTDDVTAHEWGHAYTQHTHGLIYQWQPGALNEAYSDVWGEVVDFINGRGTDEPGVARADEGVCSVYSPPVGQLHVSAPAEIAGDYFAQSAGFGPSLLDTGPIAGDVVVALDAANAQGTPASTRDGCTAITNATEVAGRIALVYRGACEFSTKVLNAQNAGAIGVIVANNAPTGLPGMGAGAAAPFVTIPSLGVQQSTGDAIRGRLDAGAVVSAILRANPGTDASVRWLIGEDSSAFGGAIRDMWNPTCYANPGKVSDTAYYHCDGAVDNGGVHINSGIPNHGFALLVDGGTYNGRTVRGLGLVKAAHLYFHAQANYQHPASDFADHADALETSCAELTGAPLRSLTGGPDETIAGDDCQQVANMIAAVELRSPPAACNFKPLLAPEAPAFCADAGDAQPIRSWNFDGTEPSDWTVHHQGATADFTSRDFTWSSELPDGRAGSAYFGPDPAIGTCAPGGDESGVLYLTSPVIPLTAAADLRASFWHWVATESGWDGGNLAVSVNGGPFQVVPPGAILFNAYNTTLQPIAAGNTNPLAGQAAWSGTNGGSLDDGSWGRTDVDLAAVGATPGGTVQLRWTLGTDGCNGVIGWYVDDVSVYGCTP